MVPEGRAEEVIVSRFAVTTSVIATDLVCDGLPLSLTVTVKFEVPLFVGAPEITPLVDDKLNPAGRLPEVIDHV